MSKQSLTSAFFINSFVSSGVVHKQLKSLYFGRFSIKTLLSFRFLIKETAFSSLLLPLFMTPGCRIILFAFVESAIFLAKLIEELFPSFFDLSAGLEPKM